MNKTILFYLTILLLTGPLLSEPSPSGFRIKYISAENIYLDGGTGDGLMVNDTLIIKQDHSITQIKIVYASEASSACQIIKSDFQIKQNDYAVLITKRITPLESPQKIRKKTVHDKPVLKRKADKKRFRTRIRGSVSGQWYHFEDNSRWKYHISQPAARLNLKIKNLWAEGVHFQMRFRSRQTQRSQQSSITLNREPWDHRLYTISLSYEKSGAPWSLHLGRMISNRLSGLGSIDGFSIQRNLNQHFGIGIVTGTQSQWQYGRSQPSFRKYGLYIHLQYGRHYHQMFQSTWAISGTYHDKIISREFIYTQNQVNWHRLHLYQTAEVDIHRNWRQKKTGRLTTLSNLYMLGDFQTTSWLSFGLRFDNRRQIWTYQTRTLEDSLFEEALRRGIRGQIKFKLPWQTSLGFDAGLRQQAHNSEKAFSWSGRFHKSHLIHPGLNLGLRTTSFKNKYTSGHSQSVQLSQYIRRIHSINVGYSRSAYTLRSIGKHRENQRIRLDTSIQLKYHLYLSEQYEYTWGTDHPGHQVFIELGIRF